uniref:Nuclear pore protein n=1 Tax=Angiostrongylus cantonensis TaxID=6313 RepID=A0A0K0DAI5_ANGCA
LFGEKGVVFGSTVPSLKAAPALPKPEDYIELDEDMERVNLETDRAFFNHVLLSRPQPTKIPDTALNRFPIVNPTVTNRRQLVFAEKLRKFLRSKKKRDLCQLFSDAVKESGTDGSLAGVWTEVLALIDRKISGDHDDPTSISLLIEKACLFLEKLFVEHMVAQVERNLERAQRGGVPGTRGLVDAFLKIGADDSFAEDGTVEGLPVWEVTYHCLRAGDLSSAKDALELLANFPQAAVLVLKKKLKVEWRHNLNSTKDKYKRALYATLLGMGNTVYIRYIRKTSLIDPNLSATLYAEVQKNISIDYGESYFMAGGVLEFHYYFTVLWLSGQFERAVKLLFDCGHVTDAVHVGILAYEMGFLRNTVDAAAELLVVDSSHLTKCSFNMARLLVSYTKEFELDDYARALDYWFILKGIRTPSGSDVFEMAVSRAVYLTGQTDAIIGTLGPKRKRTPALIDEYIENPSDVISRVAHDTELGGDTTQAVKLYILANAPRKAADLLCSELSDAIRLANTRIFIDLPQQFVSGGLLKSHYGVSYVLVGFFYVVHITRYLIPAETEQVPVIVGEFHLVPTKVREVIPDLCLHLMRCMVDAIQATSSRSVMFNKQVKAIVIYAATVNYKFPQHITSKLLQLQASVAVYQ